MRAPLLLLSAVLYSSVWGSAVESTAQAYEEASERHDAANAELLDALAAAAQANIHSSSASLSLSMASLSQALSADDPAPPPPPWYMQQATEKQLQPRSAATQASVAKTAAAAAEANQRRDEANLKLMQATSNAIDLNSVAVTQRLSANFAWAANAMAPDDPAPPPPPVPIAPRVVLKSAQRPPVEKVMSVEAAAAQDEAASQRLDAAANLAARTNYRATQKTMDAFQPVLKDAAGQIFKASPPPPPLNAVRFGTDMLTSYALGDSVGTAKTLSGGAEYGTGVAHQILSSVQGTHKKDAKAIDAILHLATDHPPPPPSAEAALAVKHRADAAASAANAELAAATSFKAKSSADLAEAHVAAVFGIKPDETVRADAAGKAPSAVARSAPAADVEVKVASTPLEKVMSVQEAEQQQQMASARLNTAASTAYTKNVASVHATFDAMQPVFQETVAKILPSPSPPPPPFNAFGFGVDLFKASTSLDASSGSKTLAGGADHGINLAHATLSSASGVYHAPAEMADHALHYATDKPPPPPSSTAALAAMGKAHTEALAASAELAAAAKEAATATVTLAQAHAAQVMGQPTGATGSVAVPAEKVVDAPAVATIPGARSAAADEAAEATAITADEARGVADAANERLNDAIGTAVEAKMEYLSAGAAHVQARIEDAFDHANPFVTSPSPPASPPSPPLTADQLGMDLMTDLLTLDVSSGAHHLTSAGQHVSSHPKETYQSMQSTSAFKDSKVGKVITNTASTTLGIPITAKSLPSDAALAAEDASEATQATSAANEIRHDSPAEVAQVSGGAAVPLGVLAPIGFGVAAVAAAWRRRRAHYSALEYVPPAEVMV